MKLFLFLFLLFSFSSSFAHIANILCVCVLNVCITAVFFYGHIFHYPFVLISSFETHALAVCFPPYHSLKSLTTLFYNNNNNNTTNKSHPHLRAIFAHGCYDCVLHTHTHAQTHTPLGWLYCACRPRAGFSVYTKYSSYNPVSRRDSEQASLSSGRTDSDTMSLSSIST